MKMALNPRTCRFRYLLNAFPWSKDAELPPLSKQHQVDIGKTKLLVRQKGLLNMFTLKSTYHCYAFKSEKWLAYIRL